MSLAKLGEGTLVFVPGIMGSELIQKDSAGGNRATVVWGEQCAVMWQVLSRSPELLGSRDLVATKVLRSINLGYWRAEQVYGPLLDFCCSPRGLGLVHGHNFRTFAYDWRRDLRVTAAKLEDFVAQLPEPVFLVAHSMGGLVARLMLNLNGPGAARVKGMLQIASPVAGSSDAFVTLKRSPSFGRIADGLFRIYNKLNTAKQAVLMDALANMESLYQLLPPNTSKILLKKSGVQISAVDISAWQPRDHRFIVDAANVHSLLAVAPSTPIKCIYTVDRATAWLIAVNDHWAMTALAVEAFGDGTVTSASASAVSIDKVPLFGGEHTQMCSRHDVHDELRRFLK